MVHVWFFHAYPVSTQTQPDPLQVGGMRFGEIKALQPKGVGRIVQITHFISMNKFAEAHDVIWDECIHLTQNTLNQGDGWIDDAFGKGYAKQHPELLAAYLSATMLGYAGSVIAAAIQDSRPRE